MHSRNWRFRKKGGHVSCVYMRACACVRDRISSFQADTVRERGAASYIIIAARCTSRDTLNPRAMEAMGGSIIDREGNAWTDCCAYRDLWKIWSSWFIYVNTNFNQSYIEFKNYSILWYDRDPKIRFRSFYVKYKKILINLVRVFVNVKHLSSVLKRSFLITHR